jgi:lysophospholipase L1-like esterase
MVESGEAPQSAFRGNSNLVRSLLRIVTTLGVLVMAALVKIPPLGLAGFGIVGIASALGQSSLARGRFRASVLIFALAGTVLAADGLWHVRNDIFSDNYYAIMAGITAATILPLRRGLKGEGCETSWRALGLFWAFAGGTLLLVEGYVRNQLLDFYLSLAALVFLLVILRRGFRLPTAAILTLHTVVLLLIGIPMLDLLLRAIPHPAARRPVPEDELYLYENAKENPASFGRWCEAYDEQFHRTVKEAFVPDPAGQFPPRPRPNAKTAFFDSAISINSLGFRGKEVSREKGDTYRIVALGESTTWGMTMRTNDTPWPEVLERMIRDRFQPERPVEVINAGIPCWELKANIQRMAKDILPLRPDMIISYHGYNGFGMIRGIIPLSNRYVVPIYRPRPIKLLADCEFRLRVLRAVRGEQALLASRASASIAPPDTEYAKAYEELIGIARTNNIKLVLADYCMAVNEHSPQPILNFYRRRYPSVAWWIKDNQIHTAIVKGLAERNPEIRFVDTQPSLDGEHHKFIDLMHLTQAGRQQLAENIFSGIRDLVQTNLVRPPATRQ